MIGSRTIRIPDVVVDIDAARPDVFAYLVDPRHRPRWQSSLRRVDAVTSSPGIGAGGLGTTWVDVTAVPGVRPRMAVIEHEQDRRWTEVGTWRGIEATLTLTFDDAGTDAAPATRVRALVTFSLPWAAVPAVRLARSLVATAIGKDLRAAAAEVAGRP